VLEDPLKITSPDKEHKKGGKKWWQQVETLRCVTLVSVLQQRPGKLRFYTRAQSSSA